LQNTELAKKFGLPYVMVRNPKPYDTTVLNYNWQIFDTYAFSVYSGNTDTINKESAKVARMDRYTILSERNLALLTEYWFRKGRPKGILFPNQFTGQYLTVSTLEQVIRRSASAAGLSGVTPHCLRHSFATHLMEQGVEQRNIQALLGHRDPKSTEVYLHVSNKSIMGIRSPFDRKDGTANG
jgi:integrase